MPETYSLTDLANAAGVSARTIRYYIEEGLLPPPEAKGPQTSYGPEYLDRLRLIAELKKAFLPLAEIRERTAGLSRTEIRKLLEVAKEETPITVREAARDLYHTAHFEPRPPLRPIMRSASMRAPEPPKPPEPDSGKDSAKEYISRLLEDRVEMPPKPRPPSPPTKTGSDWVRTVLADGVELHVRKPVDPLTDQKVQLLITRARELFRKYYF